MDFASICSILAVEWDIEIAHVVHEVNHVIPRDGQRGLVKGVETAGRWRAARRGRLVVTSQQMGEHVEDEHVTTVVHTVVTRFGIKQMTGFIESTYVGKSSVL